MLREMTSQTRLDLITLQSWTQEVCLMVKASKRRRKSYASTAVLCCFVESVTFGAVARWLTFHLIKSLRHCSHVGERPSVCIIPSYVCSVAAMSLVKFKSSIQRWHLERSNTFAALFPPCSSKVLSLRCSRIS